MLRLNISLVLVMLTLPASLMAAGAVIDTTIVSPSLGFDRDIRVYLPEGYHDDETRRYPVVYFLHGAVVTYHIYWSQANLAAMLDALIEDGTVMPFIFVTPDGSIEPYAGSFYTNSALYGDFEDFIAYDLPASIDDAYRTINSRHFRAIMGHSMGGYGCMKAALKHPDLFGVVASHSGVLDLWLAVDLRRDEVMQENDCITCPPYEYDPTMGDVTLLMFTYAGAFSPNLDNPPYLVDLPMDPYGGIDEEVMERWHPHDPPHLAAQLPPGDVPAIYFDCGLQDQRECLPMNDAFADSLDALGIPYEYQTYTGGHWDQLHLRIPIALIWLDSVWGAVGAPQEFVPGVPSVFVYPNPFNPQTTINFALSRPQHAEVAVYDLSGRLLGVLADHSYGAGDHSVVWNGKDAVGRALPSGTYIVRLETESGVDARKVMLLR